MLLNEKIEYFLRTTYTPSLFIKNKNDEMHITKRETECLYYLSQGKTYKEIARSLDLSPRTIEFYTKNLKEHSGYKTRAELIMYHNRILPQNN